MHRNLLFQKNCKVCRLKLELEICLCCNNFVNICKDCVQAIVSQYFSDSDINILVYKDAKTLSFIKLLMTSNFILFCKKCINLGIYYTDNDSKINMLINLYLKRHKSF
jgi:hypothetical protein